LGRFRRITTAGPSPLSLSDIVQYARILGLSGTESVLFFVDMIAAMDGEYLKYSAKRIEQQTKLKRKFQKSRT